jgi:hypothetical protein
MSFAQSDLPIAPELDEAGVRTNLLAAPTTLHADKRNRAPLESDVGGAFGSMRLRSSR